MLQKKCLLMMSKGGNWLLRAQTVRLCFYFSVTRTSANGRGCGHSLDNGNKSPPSTLTYD